MAVGFDFNEPVQSYRVEKVEFHERPIACINRNVRRPPKPAVRDRPKRTFAGALRSYGWAPIEGASYERPGAGALRRAGVPAFRALRSDKSGSRLGAYQSP
jgi:hypothetical protein